MAATFGARARGAVAGARGAEQRVKAADADVRAADASLMLARATYDRIVALQARRSATSQELDEATANLRAAEARSAAAQARLQEATSAVDSSQADSEAASTLESFTAIAAPFDGLVTEKMVDPGNMAAPGAPLVRVEDTGGFRLEVRVDESRAGRTRSGTAVPVPWSRARGAPRRRSTARSPRCPEPSTAMLGRCWSRLRCPPPTVFAPVCSAVRGCREAVADR
jgi:multidrug resistance efflux pump